MPGMEGRFLEANPAIVQMFGYPSKEEFLQIPLAQLYQNPQRREEFNREVGEDGSVRVRNMELELKKRDGTSFIGSVSAVGVKGENGEVQYYDGIIEDTTEHKRMEDDLRQSEAKYRNFFENALVGIFQSSPEGRMLGANAAYVRMFGFDSPEQILSEITNAGLQLYANPEDRKVFLELVTEHGVMQPNEFEMMRRDGMRFWVSATASAVRDAKGKVLYYEGTCVDIAERKRAEEAQRESETRYRELFDHISSGVAIYRARDNGNDFVFQDYNQAGEKLDGDRLENVIGKSVLETRPGIKEFGLFDVFQGVWETGVPEHFPVAHYQDNKISGWYENYVYKLPSGEIVAVYDNVTERKQAEEALRESEEKYRTLVEKAQEGIAIIQDIAVQYVNPLLAERWGGQAEEMIGLPISRFIPPESLANLVDRVQRQIAGEPLDAQVEAIFFRKDDSRANTELTSGLISYHGRPALLLMVRDITERKQAEKSLRIQGTMLENLAEGVMVADAWNRITYVNPAFERIFGYERGELIGQDLSILNDLPPEESKRLAQEIFHQCRSKVPGEGKSATGARMASLS
jgi:two-component system cell cycle sensor histidine kinase/response regulator CckA